MSSWGLPKLGLGLLSGSEPPSSPTISEKSIATSKSMPMNAAQPQAFNAFVATMQQPKREPGSSSSPPPRLGASMSAGSLSMVPESRQASFRGSSPPRPGLTATPKESLSTSDLMQRASLDTRALEVAAKDETERLLRWDQEAQQVDKEQSEVMHQQWRLFREQVATLSGEAINMRGEIKDLYRVADEEAKERRAGVEAVSAALRGAEERIFAILDELRRNQLSTIVQGIEVERAERISACKKLSDDLEAEVLARDKACGELATDVGRLRNSLEEGFQKSTIFMKEQSSIIETRVRESEAALQQVIRNIDHQLGEEKKARFAGDSEQERSLDEKFMQLRTVLAEFGSKSDVGALKNELERETTERIRSDQVFEEKLLNLRPVLAESATKTELQALRNGLEQEMAERGKGDDSILDGLKQGLERARTEREEIRLLTEALAKNMSQDFTSLLETRVTDAEALIQQLSHEMRLLLEEEAKSRAARDVELEDKFVQLGPVLAEAAAKADFERLRTELERVGADLEREAAVRAEGDKDSIKQQLVETALRELATDLHNQIEQEVKTRTAGDDQLMQLLTEGFEKAGNARIEIVRMVESTEAKIIQSVQSSLEEEAKIRMTGDQELMKNLQDGLEVAGRQDSEMAVAVESTEARLVQTFKNALEEEAKLRAASDENTTRDLEDKFAQLRPLLVDFAGKADVANLRGELEDKLVQLRSLLADAASKADFTALRGEIERVSPAVRAEFDDKFSALRPILAEAASKSDLLTVRADLERETKERALGDENLINILKQESGERVKAHTELTRSVEDSHQTIQRSVVERHEVMSRSLDSHVTGYSQDQNVHGARFNELKSILETMTASVTSDFNTLRSQLEAEERARMEGDGVLEKQIMRSHTEHKDRHEEFTDHHSQFAEERRLIEDEVGKKLAELARSIEGNQAEQERRVNRFKDELDGAKQEKQTDDSKLKQVLQDMEGNSAQRAKDIIGRLDAEAAYRQNFEQELVERIKKIVESVEFEAQERRTQAEKLQTGLQGIPVEVFSQQLKDVWSSLENEAAQRKAGDDALEGSVHNGFETVARKQAEQEGEWQRGIEIFKRALDETASSHKEELAKTSTALHSKLQEERNMLSQNLQDLTNQVDSHKDHHATVVRDHSSKHDDTLQRMEQLVKYFEHEKNARQEENEALRRAYETALTDLERTLHDHKRTNKDESGQMADIVRQLHEKIENGLQDHGRAVADVHERLQGTAKAHSDRHEDIARQTADVDRRRQATEADFLRRMQEIEQQFEKNLEKRFREHTDKHEALDSKMTLELKRTSDQHTARLNDMKDMLNGHKEKLATLDREIHQKVQGYQSEHKERLAAAVKDIESKVQGAHNQHADKIAVLSRDLAGQLQDSLQQERREREKVSGDLMERLQNHGGELERKLKDHTADLEQTLRTDMKKGLDEHAQAHSDTKQKLEGGLQGVLTDTHSTLQNELQELKKGMDVDSLRAHLTTVVKQVDSLEAAVQAEKDLRSDMEADVENQCKELRADLEFSLMHLGTSMQEVMELKRVSGNLKRTPVATAEPAARSTSPSKQSGSPSKPGAKATSAPVAGSSRHSLPTEYMSETSGGMIGKLETRVGNLGKMMQEQVDKLEAYEKKMGALEREIRGDLEKTAAKFGSAQQSLKGDLEKTAAQIGSAQQSLKGDIEKARTEARSESKKIAEQTQALQSRVIADQSAKELESQVVEEHVKDTVKRSSVSRRGSDLGGSLSSGALAGMVAGGSANQPGSVRDMLTDLGSQLDSLTEAVEQEQDLRMALAEQVQKNTAALEDAMNQGQSSLSEAIRGIEKKLTADLSSFHEEHNSRHSSHQAALQDTFSSIHEKLKADIQELESGVSGKNSNINAIVADLASQVDTLTSSVQEQHKETRIMIVERVHSVLQDSDGKLKSALEVLRREVEENLKAHKADSALRVAVEEKLEEKCKALRADVDQALDEVHAGLKLELAALSGKKDELDKAMKEVHGALQKEVKEHKEHTEKQKSLLQKELMDHKKGSEEEKRSRDAAHSNLHTELKNRDRLHKGLDGKMDDVEKRLKSALDQLGTKHQTHAESMNTTERRLRDEMAKLNQGTTTRQNELERKLREEFTSAHKKMQKEVSELSRALNDKSRDGDLRGMLTKAGKDVEALKSSVQEEVRLRTAAQDKLSSRCDVLRAELTDVAREQHAALRTELSQYGSKSKELEAAMQSANEALRKEIRDHKNTVQSENDSLRSQIQRNSATSTPTFRKTEEGSGLVRESDVRQWMQSDIERINSRFRDEQNALRNDVADVERKLRKELKRLCDDAEQGQREGLREVRDDLDRINNEHLVQHKETRVMIIEQVRSVLQDSDGKVKHALEELRREVEDHRENLKLHLTSQRGLDSESLLTSAVQRLEDEMERVHTLAGEVTQLKLDQDLSQGNLDRRMRDLDLVTGTVDQLQADHDTLRRSVNMGPVSKYEPSEGWEEEVRRIWEAIDTHTHDVAVEDFEEQEKASKSVVRNTQVIREVHQHRAVPAPIQRTVAIPTAVQTVQMSVPHSPKAVTRIPQTMPITRQAASYEASVRPRALASGNSVQASPAMSPFGSMSTPLGSMAGLHNLSSSQKLLTAAQVSPVASSAQAVERVAPAVPAGVASAGSIGTVERMVPPESPVMGIRSPSMVSMRAVEVAPVMTAHTASRSDVTATVGRAIHDIRHDPTVTTTETRIEHTGKIHHHIEAHVGKAMFEHSSELDPETHKA